MAGTVLMKVHAASQHLLAKFADWLHHITCIDGRKLALGPCVQGQRAHNGVPAPESWLAEEHDGKI